MRMWFSRLIVLAFSAQSLDVSAYQSPADELNSMDRGGVCLISNAFALEQFSTINQSTIRRGEEASIVKSNGAYKPEMTTG